SEYGGGIRCWNASPTIRNCKIIGNAAGTSYGLEDKGGGVACVGAAPLIDLCVISGNLARSGAALHARDVLGPTLVNCVVSSNNALYDVGGIDAATAAQVTVINCTIIYNQANGGAWPPVFGAGLGAHSGATIDVVNSIVWGNAFGPAYIEGGMISASYSDLS